MSTTPDIEVVSAGSSRHVSVHSLEPEIIMIGAGVIGCVLAYSLSRAGRNIVILERDLSEPDRIVGELLQPGGVAALEELGLGGPDGVLAGIDAVPVEGYCVVNGAETVGIPYPLIEEMADGKARENGHLETETVGEGSGRTLVNKWHVDSKSGKKEGRSFHHGRLISALRKKIIGIPRVTVLEATVRDLVFCEHTHRVIGVSAAFKKASVASSLTPAANSRSDADAASHIQEKNDSAPLVRKIYAPITIIADGCFSKFRQPPGLQSRIPTPQLRSHFVGAILHDCKLPMKHLGTVCLTPKGPVLLYQIGNEKGEVRLLVDVKGKLPSVGDGSLKRVILEDYMPHLPASLHPSLRSALDTQRLRVMPNSFLPPSKQGTPSSLSGAILVGDAYNMRHPLTGGGMTVAFNDAVILSKYLKPSEELPAGRDGLDDWNKIAGVLEKWFYERKGVSSVVNVLSIALYDLFGGAEEPDLEILREGCFRYFELGGERVAGPVGLLSALTPKRVTLFYHFFSVALYSIWILLTRGTPKNSSLARKGSALAQLPLNILLSFRVFWTACVVLLPVLYTEFKV